MELYDQIYKKVLKSWQPAYWQQAFKRQSWLPKYNKYNKDNVNHTQENARRAKRMKA